MARVTSDLTCFDFEHDWTQSIVFKVSASICHDCIHSWRLDLRIACWVVLRLKYDHVFTLNSCFERPIYASRLKILNLDVGGIVWSLLYGRLHYAFTRGSISSDCRLFEHSGRKVWLHRIDWVEGKKSVNRPMVIVSVLVVFVARLLLSMIFMISTPHVTEVHAGAQMLVATLGLAQNATRHVTTLCPLLGRDCNVYFGSCTLFPWYLAQVATDWIEVIWKLSDLPLCECLFISQIYQDFFDILDVFILVLTIEDACSSTQNCIIIVLSMSCSCLRWEKTYIVKLRIFIGLIYSCVVGIAYHCTPCSRIDTSLF